MKKRWYALWMFFFVCSTTCFAGNAEMVSVDSFGTSGNYDSTGISINSTGRYVVFTSAATNLVENDTNGYTDVFIRDRDLGITERISVNSNEGQAISGDSYGGSINSDGRYVVFISKASNLDSNDTNNCVDVFVRDRFLGTTTRVSLDENGNQFANIVDYYRNPTISGDGRYIAFCTYEAWNKVYYRDRINNITKKVAGGDGVNPAPRYAVISGNGRYVVFTSVKSYDSLDANNYESVYAYDIEEPDSLKKYKLISKSTNEINANGHVNGALSISYDGRYIVFSSGDATNLVENTPPPSGLFVRDIVKNVTEFACPGAVNSGISADGRYVACYTGGALVADDTNAYQDTYVMDRKLGTATRTSVPYTGGQYYFGAGSPLLSDDGRVTSFTAKPAAGAAVQVYIYGDDDYMCP